ncbi:MAG: hypothetical protein ACFNX0_06375 [Treponema sp.]
MRMQIVLEKAGLPDAQTISDMQKSFQKLLEHCRDYDTNPVAETVQKIITRMEQHETQYYFILHNQKNVGAIRVVCMNGGALCRISPIFILPGELKTLNEKCILSIIKKQLVEIGTGFVPFDRSVKCL